MILNPKLNNEAQVAWYYFQTYGHFQQLNLSDRSIYRFSQRIINKFSGKVLFIILIALHLYKYFYVYLYITINR